MGPGVWPPIKHGIWKIDTTRVLPNGKAKHSSRSFSACGDTSYLFMGYWGGGIVEIEGCQYTAVVTMHGPEAFELRGTVRETKKTYGVTEVGRRISDSSSGQQP